MKDGSPTAPRPSNLYYAKTKTINQSEDWYLKLGFDLDTYIRKNE